VKVRSECNRAIALAVFRARFGSKLPYSPAPFSASGLVDFAELGQGLHGHICTA